MRNQKMGLLLLLLQFTLDSLMGARTLVGLEQDQIENTNKPPWRIHTLFSVECRSYFDWQTVGLMHSFRKSGQPGPITRLMSCTDEEFKGYRGMDLAPTMKVPSMSSHPRTGDWYPAINKPAGVLHWLTHSEDVKNVDWVVILDADMIIRGLILPWELGAEKGKPVAAYYGYLVGCDNILAGLHTKHPELCDKVGGLLVMHIDDLQALAPLWLSKTEEVRGDRAHWGTNITGDIYSQGWISEMYGYSFGAAEVGLRHKISDDLMIYPGYIPRKGVVPILLHYGLPFSVGNWSFSKFDHHEDDVVYDCGRLFPAPPYPREGIASLGSSLEIGLRLCFKHLWIFTVFAKKPYLASETRFDPKPISYPIQNPFPNFHSTAIIFPSFHMIIALPIITDGFFRLG